MRAVVKKKDFKSNDNAKIIALSLALIVVLFLIIVNITGLNISEEDKFSPPPLPGESEGNTAGVISGMERETSLVKSESKRDIIIYSFLVIFFLLILIISYLIYRLSHSRKNTLQ